ncbi:hypothetical protein ACMFMF_006361 [Clarireedia jacksonii]
MYELFPRAVHLRMLAASPARPAHLPQGLNSEISASRSTASFPSGQQHILANTPPINWGTGNAGLSSTLTAVAPHAGSIYPASRDVMQILSSSYIDFVLASFEWCVM